MKLKAKPFYFYHSLNYLAFVRGIEEKRNKNNIHFITTTKNETRKCTDY